MQPKNSLIPKNKVNICLRAEKDTAADKAISGVNDIQGEKHQRANPICEASTWLKKSTGIHRAASKPGSLSLKHEEPNQHRKRQQNQPDNPQANPRGGMHRHCHASADAQHAQTS